MACKCKAGFRVFTVMPDTPKAAEVNWLCAGTGERHVVRLTNVDRVPGGEMDGKPLTFEPLNLDGGAMVYACKVSPEGIQELRAKMDDAVTKLHDVVKVVKDAQKKWVKKEPNQKDFEKLVIAIDKIKEPV